MQKRVIALALFSLALLLVVGGLLFALTPQGSSLLGFSAAASQVTPTPRPSPTIIAPTPPAPTPTLKPVITVRGALPQVQAQVAYLIDMDTGNVLLNNNGERPLPMASTTKIMTALIAVQTGDLNQPVTISQNAYDRVHKNNGSSAQLVVGDTLTLKDLVYGMMLVSGNDAAVAIAEALAGSHEAFVERMNLFAQRLGLFNTHFYNADGLSKEEEDSKHYSNARDMAYLSRYAMEMPAFVEIVQAKDYAVAASESNHAYHWENTNPLTEHNYPGTLGVKPGHTWTAGWCLVFAAKRGDHFLLGVLLNSPTEEQREKDAMTLLDWGFALPLLPPITT